MRYAAPIHLSNENASAEAASSADTPSAAAAIWTKQPAEMASAAAAPAERRAARHDIGDVRPGRDVEEKAGGDEEPEVMDAKHRASRHYQARLPGNTSCVCVT